MKNFSIYIYYYKTKYLYLICHWIAYSERNAFVGFPAMNNLRRGFYFLMVKYFNIKKLN